MADPGPRPFPARRPAPDGAGGPSDVRGHIVRAARGVFERVPFRYVTLVDLQAAAEVDADTFGAHFGTVGDVLCATYDDVIDSVGFLYATLGEVTARPDPQRMSAWIDTFLAQCEVNHDILRAIREAAVLDPSVARHMQMTLDRALDEAIGPVGVLSPARRTEYLTVVRVLLTQLSQACLEWLVQGADRAARTDLIRSQTTIWTGSLRAF